ncbi:hypothetical protein Lbir_2120 [Legionella birminghamensis]|uniref:Phasin protein n=2 Tax=Legionella birminghamensis TaxID=28083 RepID=A0A378IHI0_9GAMM|nr:hypothetical protein Lbir_2120 [Legionella birminghamensis]STX31644.1 Uncharacterised protein [Legionella birminghamensis]
MCDATKLGNIMIMENYMNQLNQLARQMQKPMEEMMQLNIKTLQSFQPKTEHLQKIERPEMLWERQICNMIESGHKWLDYVEKSFEITERAMLQFVKGFGQFREDSQTGHKSAFDTAMSNMSHFNPMTAWQDAASQALDSSAMEGIDPTQIVREVAESAGIPRYKKEPLKPAGNGSVGQTKMGKRSEKGADKKDKH